MQEIIPYFVVNDDLHGWSHTQRVFNNSIRILTNGLNVNSDVVKTSIYLHDIARKMEMDGECNCHAEEGSKISKELLTKKEVSNDFINNVIYAISVHRVSKDIKAETIESKILQDADRLDALGAIIIARCFDYGSRKKRAYYIEGVKPRDIYDGSLSFSTIQHMQEKILKLNPEKFHTQKAKEIAKERYKFVNEFVDRFIKEWKGVL